MATKTISARDIYNFFPKSRIMDTSPLIKVELILEINFETFGQVKYTDENGRPWIKEFEGNKWSKEILLKQAKDVQFSVFINNQYLRKEGLVTLIKKVNNELVNQMAFELTGDKLFEGWFKLA